MSRIVGRTLKKGTLATAGALGAFQLGGEREYDLMSDIYGDSGIYKGRDRLNKELNRLVGSRKKPSNVASELSPLGLESRDFTLPLLDKDVPYYAVTGLGSNVDTLVENDILNLLGIMYGGALGLTVVGDVVKKASAMFKDRANAKRRIKTIKAAMGKDMLKGLKISTRDVMDGKMTYDAFKNNGEKINLRTWKNMSPGRRLIYLSYTTKIPPLEIIGGMTTREKEFLKKHDARLRAKAPKALPPPPPKIAPYAVIHKNPKYPPGSVPLALRPKPVGTLFNEILGTPEERRRISQKQASDKWWASLSAKEQKKHLKKMKKETKKFAAKLKREKLLKKILRRGR